MVSASAATSPFDCDGEVLLQVAVRHRRHDLHDAAHLLGQVGGHDVDRIGEVLPGAGDAGHLRLTAELAFGADFARHARHFAGEGVELVDHGVDGVLQLQDFALDVHRDLARQVAAGHGGRHLGDVADLGGQVRGQQVDVVGQVLPGAGDAGHDGLPAELAFGADLARHARHLRREGAELVDHRVEGLLQLQDLAAHVHGDLARQVAVGDGGRDLGDVAHLAVRLPAMELTLSVRSFQVPATPGTWACPPSLPSVPTPPADTRFDIVVASFRTDARATLVADQSRLSAWPFGGASQTGGSRSSPARSRRGRPRKKRSSGSMPRV